MLPGRVDRSFESLGPELNGSLLFTNLIVPFDIPFSTSSFIYIMAVYAAESSRLYLQTLSIRDHLESYHRITSNEASMMWS